MSPRDTKRGPAIQAGPLVDGTCELTVIAWGVLWRRLCLLQTWVIGPPLLRRCRGGLVVHAGVDPGAAPGRPVNMLLFDIDLIGLLVSVFTDFVSHRYLPNLTRCG